MRCTRYQLVPTAVAASMATADWNAEAAADYLDTRQKDWFVCPAANGQGVPCNSCITGPTELLARSALGETSPSALTA